jgi:uncharacterized integral membrane protein
MRRFPTWLALAAVVALGVAFAMGNAGRAVSINLGFLTLSRVPVTFVAFGGMVVGMGVVLVAGINADLKVRRLLRERHAREGLAEGPGGPAYDESEQGDMRLE